MNFYPTRAVRTRRWKYIRNLDPTLEFHSHVDLAPGDTGYWPSWAAKAEHDATARAMVEHYIRRPAEELFDLDADPFEQRNLATDPAHTATLAAMRAKLDGWMAERGDRGIATDRAVRPPLPPAKS